MKAQIIEQIEKVMQLHLSDAQMQLLHKTLNAIIPNAEENSTEERQPDYIQIFLAAKRVEGCSDKTIRYYESTIRNVLTAIKKSPECTTTDDIRLYLDEYQQKSGASKVTIDNIRRILSSFFSWMEDEDYIVKSPVRRIHKVKTCKTVKETYTDEALEIMRDSADCVRDLAIIDMLASTGMRVGDADGKISLNQQKPSNHAGLRRFGPEKFLQRNNEFMKERPIFYKNPIKIEKDFSTWLRCFYYTTKAVITEYINF